MRVHKVILSGKQLYTEQEIPVNKIDPGDVDIGQTVCGGDGPFSDLVSFHVTNM